MLKFKCVEKPREKRDGDCRIEWLRDWEIKILGEEMQTEMQRKM